MASRLREPNLAGGAIELGNDRVCVELGTERKIVVVAEGEQVFAAEGITQFEGKLCTRGALKRVGGGEEFLPLATRGFAPLVGGVGFDLASDGAGSQDIFASDIAASAGAEDVDTRGVGHGVDDRLAVDGGANQRAFGQMSVGERLGAIGGGEQHGLAENLVGSVVQRRVTEIKALDRLATSFASEQDIFLVILRGFCKIFVDFDAGDDAFCAVGECLADGRRGTQQVDDNDDAAGEVRFGDELREIVDGYLWHRVKDVGGISVSASRAAILM